MLGIWTLRGSSSTARSGWVAADVESAPDLGTVRVSEVLAVCGSRSTFYVSNVTGWSRGLEVSGGGQWVVSHAGLATASPVRGCGRSFTCRLDQARAVVSLRPLA
jgi:hypothetical protein